MKIISSFLFAFFFSSVIYSQTNNTGFIGNLGGGLSVPTSYFADNWKTGFNITGSAGYVFHSNFGARVDVQYNSFPHGKYSFTTINGVKYNNGTVVSGGACGTFSIKCDLMAGSFEKKSKIIPYGVLGAGLYVVSTSDLVVTHDSIGTYTDFYGSETAFGFGIGGGIGFRLRKNIAVFGEVQFDDVFEIFQPDPSFISFKAGIMLTP